MESADWWLSRRKLLHKDHRKGFDTTLFAPRRVGCTSVSEVMACFGSLLGFRRRRISFGSVVGL
jgi:hypothetical protein